MKEENKDAVKRVESGLMGILKKYKTVFIVLITGVLLLLSGGLFQPTRSTPSESTDETLTPVSASEGFELQSFQAELEEKLGAIKGAGRVSLMLSLEQTEQSVYAVDYKESQSADSRTYESGLTIVSSGSQGQAPISIKTVYPVFRGAVVLCEGADNAEVQYAITQAVSTICGIGTDKVSVLKLRGTT